MVVRDFPARAWPDMCAAYRDTALAQACLTLQQGHAVDVPLLLVLSLADRAGYGVAPEALTGLSGDAAAWRDTVVVPLRGVRQAMKWQFTAPGELALRDQLKRLELEAEHQHVLRIVANLPPADGHAAAARHYLLSCGTTAADADRFATIFEAACAAQLASADHE